MRRVLPVTPELHGQAFVVRLAGRLHATPLLVALLVLELSDIVFAVDSVPAIFAITREPLLVFTSNVCAILGLRAMYFLLADAVQRFHLLHYGLALVLIFVGLKMVWLDGAAGGKLPIEWSLGVIAVLLAGAVAASLLVGAAGAGRSRLTAGGGHAAAWARMPSVTMPTFCDAGGLGGVDHLDHLAVGQARRADQEQGLLAPGRRRSPAAAPSGRRDRLAAGSPQSGGRRSARRRSAPSGGVARRACLGLGRQVDVGALLGHRQRRHEDHEQDEQDVDERRDVHVRAAGRDDWARDGIGAEMLPGDVRHDSPPPGTPRAADDDRLSVTRTNTAPRDRNGARSVVPLRGDARLALRARGHEDKSGVTREGDAAGLAVLVPGGGR